MNIIKGNTKHKSKIISVFFIMLFLLLSYLTLSPNGTSANQEAVELQKMIEERSKRIEELNKEIQQYQELTDKTSQEAKTLQSRIKQLENNARSIDLEIKRIRERVEVANLDIKKLGFNISESEGKVEQMRKVLAESIKNIHQMDDTNIIQTILNNRNFSSTLEELNAQISYTNSLKQYVDLTKKHRTELQTVKSSQESRKAELEKLQVELAGKKEAVVQTKSEQDSILKVTKNQEQEYQKLLKEKQAAKTAFEKDLFEYESKLKYTLNPSSLPKSGGDSFVWPLENITITQQFGRTVAAQRLYVSGSHNGTDFRAPIGTKVMSIGSGTVMGTGDTDLECKGVSWGRWVFIRHNNGLSSMYAHLSSISVKQGQTVSAGEMIGLSGNTGYSTGPHLHLTVYASDAVQVQSRPSVSCRGRVFLMPIAPIQAYLDPLLYLPKR